MDQVVGIVCREDGVAALVQEDAKLVAQPGHAATLSDLTRE
jgi:hypothetical protein